MSATRYLWRLLLAFAAREDPVVKEREEHTPMAISSAAVPQNIVQNRSGDGVKGTYGILHQAPSLGLRPQGLHRPSPPSG